MNFTITVDTGNIEEDIISTINNFTKEELENFIDSIRLRKDDSKIKGRSIFFRYPDCQKILSTIKEVNKVPIETRKYVVSRTKRIDTEFLFAVLPNAAKTRFERELLSKIGTKINIRQKFCDILANDKYDRDFYEICLKIIGDENYFNKFLQYNDNLELFNRKYTQEDYVLELSRILGKEAEDICKENPIYKYLTITEEMKQRYSKLRKIINVDIKMLGENVFNQNNKVSYSQEYQHKIDTDWEVNPKLLEYIMNGIDPQYNLYEKISYIYIKLCEALRYNLGYHIKKWKVVYNKERQESITPENNSIICSEFAMIFTNIINKIDKRVEARCIITGKEQHLSVGIIIRDKNIRIDFDGTKIINDFDDLVRIKLGMEPVGVAYLCDRNGEFQSSFEKVYKNFLENQTIKTEDLIDAYEKTPKKNEIKINFYENMQEFIKRMKSKNIVGSELLSVFKKVNTLGYFGKITYSIIGQDKKLTFNARMLLETAEEVLDGLEENIIIEYENNYYLLRLDEAELIQMSIEELNKLFEQNKMRYFNPKYRIDGIGVKPCKKN